MSSEGTKQWKQALYGRFYDAYDKQQGWRTKFAAKAAHQALDLPYEDDEMQVSSVRNSGITWKEIAAAGAIALGAFGIYSSVTSSHPHVDRDTDTNTQYMLEVDREAPE